MRRILPAGRAGWRCGLAYLIAIALCGGPALEAVRAQETMIASAGEAVLLRDQPGYEAAVLATLGDGSPLQITGGAVTDAQGLAWTPVVAGGQSGYVPAGYVSAGLAAPEPAAAPEPVAASEAAVAPEVASDPAPLAAPAGTAATTTDANLRSGPSVDAAVIMVLAQGTAVSVDGEATNGFVPVTGNGVSGWLAVDLLTGDATPGTVPPTDALAAPASESIDDPPLPAPIVAETVAEPPAAAPDQVPDQAPDAARRGNTGIVWPVAGGEWEVVQGYNNGTHTNRSNFAQYKYSLDVARADGDTAGEPVYAPVSGTIQWVDRGSGGMLIDVGNGYGVAIFHATLDRSLGNGGSVERGQRIGEVSGPGGDGYMSMAHFQITVWRLAGRGHEAVPFTGPNAIAGQEYPDDGGANQYMGARISP